MKRMKNSTEQVRLAEVNENILNIITPTGIDFNNTYTNLGENTGKIYCISKFPSNADYGWLAPICSLEGTMTVIEYRYTSPDRMQAVMDKRIKEFRGSIDAAKEETERQKIKKGIDDLTEMINRIAVKNEPVGYVNVLLFPQAPNSNTLEARIKRISTVVSTQECSLRNLKYRQDKAYRVISPYGIPDVDNVSNIGERNMPLSTFLGGFPMADSGLMDKDGCYLGKSKNNRTVIVNQWLRGKDRINSNWFFTGVPGVGKSTAVKTILTNEYALGTKIIIFDPQREYIDLAYHRYINGEVVNGSGGKNGRINPLHVRKTAKVEEQDLLADENTDDYFFYDIENGTSDLALYIQQLRVFFMLYFGKENFTSDISAVLEENLIELYEKKGITWNTDINALKPEDFPIIKELYDLVEGKAKDFAKEDMYKQNTYEKLKSLLYSAAKGADSFLWNGATTLNPHADFVVVDCFQLLDLDEKVKRAQFYNLTMWGWGRLCEDRQEKVVLAVDEGYLFVDPEYPDLMKFFRNISKQDRKFEGSLMFITHAVVDILDESVKRYGQALLDNACYKFIMGTDGKNLKETKELLNLNSREETILATKNRGQGIFFCGGMRIDLRIDVPDDYLEMFGKAGGR